jgi:signal transduction histidine kinase
VGIRPKLLIIFVALGVVPFVALSVIGYLNGVRSVEAQLRGEVERDGQAVAREVETRLSEREEALVSLARSPVMSEYIRGTMQRHAGSSSSGGSSSTTQATSVAEDVPEAVRAEVQTFLQSSPKYSVAVACLSTDKQPLFRAELNQGRDKTAINFQTENFVLYKFDEDRRVWATSEQTPIRSGLRSESYGPALRYTIPVFAGEEFASAPGGALIVDLRLDALFDDAASVADSTPTPARDSEPAPRLVVILDAGGNVVYHTNDAVKYQPVTTAMPPSFKPITDAIKGGQSGWQYYDSTEGHRWLAVYQRAAPLDLTVVVAGDYTVAAQSLRWMGRLSIGLTVFLGLLMAALLMLSLRRTARSIERVTEGAVAIAGGRLDQHIEVRSSDETRLLAETFNAMTDRLREQIARETETRQFESFMRLSAMLTHDLKNSILALSLLVSNMEQQFDREEFRADAMKSLTEATDKLRALVAKLSEPVRSLSGEFKRPRPADLIPIIKRALALTAEPSASIHEVEIHLPASPLLAVIDDERIERVIENLVLNALEAMGTKKGKLTVEAGPAEDGFVFFSVSDTGPGMTEEFQRKKLFHPFATTKPQGVGLGLYTCRELIKALGGRIEVESKRGSGTCFRIVLPSRQITGSVS